MMTAEPLKGTAKAFITEANARPRRGDDDLVITDFTECRFGWSSAYQSSQWVETRDAALL